MTTRATVFISYAREDLAFAEGLYDALSAEFLPWMDKKSLVGGQDWERALTLAVRRSDFFIFCASSNSATKRGTIQKEIKLALEVWREKLEDDIYFIPVRLENCEVPDQISRFQWIDAFENGWFEKIVRALKHGIIQGNSAPGPLPISFEERIIANSPEDDRFKMKVAYPEFQPAVATGIAEINAAISVFARRIASNFSSSEHIGEESDIGIHNYLLVNFSVSTISATMISVQFEFDIYTGGAHGNQTVQTRNFSRSPFRELSPDQLPTFNKQKEFLLEISNFCQEDIARQKRNRLEEWSKGSGEQIQVEGPSEWEKDWIKTGAGPDWKNFENYWVEGNSLHFSFAPYQVASYAEGFFSCSMPIPRLEPLMRPEIVKILKG
jgi:hypothetical protein